MRTGNFNEVDLGFTARMARMEALRCLSCDLKCAVDERLRTKGWMGDTTGRPSKHDLVEIENRAAGLARWFVQESQYAQNSAVASR